MRDDDHRVGSCFVKLDVPARKALGVTMAKRAHHVAAVVAVPVARLEPAPLHVGVEDALDRLEIAGAPGIETLPSKLDGRLGHACRVHPPLVLASSFPAVAELPWTRPDWLVEAREWIDARVEVTGEIEQPHVRWWSTVLRVPTAEGDLFFKAVAPVHRFEAALTARLAELQPRRVTEVVDVDVERGWFLMRDAGRRLRELVETRDDLHHWERLLPEYAQLQLEVAPHADELLALGVPDERLAVLPNLFRELLATRPPGLTDDERARAIETIPRFKEMCLELEEDGLSETIQHDDLHDGQVFVRDGRYLVFDWGDSCVSHPFHSLTVTLRSVAWRLDLEPGGPELRRLRDLYLEPFGRPAGLADLAYRTGTIARSIAWHWMVAAREPEFVTDDDLTGPAYGIKLFLEGGPIGTWREP